MCHAARDTPEIGQRHPIERGFDFSLFGHDVDASAVRIFLGKAVCHALARGVEIVAIDQSER